MPGGCCGQSSVGVKVTFPDGTSKTFATRQEALTAIATAGGGVIRNA